MITFDVDYYRGPLGAHFFYVDFTNMLCFTPL